RVVPKLPTDLCADAFVEGSAMSFSIDNLSAFPSRVGLHIVWHARNANGSVMPDGTFVIGALPAAGTMVEVSAVATNSDGLTAHGGLDFAVQSEFRQALANLECRIRHIVDVVNRLPHIPITNIKLRREEVLANILTHAKELTAHANALAKEARSLTAGKGDKAL
ncbi:MAG TPA: hypothetical protein VIM63_06575, partial [Rhodoferax sp.]